MGEGTTAKRSEDDAERRRSTRERLDKSKALRVGFAGLALTGALGGTPNTERGHAEPTEATRINTTKEDQARTAPAESSGRTNTVRYRVGADGWLAVISAHQADDAGRKGRGSEGGENHHHEAELPESEYDPEREHTREDAWYQEPLKGNRGRKLPPG